MAKHTLMIVERYVCSVLEEMRTMYETRNFSGFTGLVEELQSYCNRMENALRGRYGAEEDDIPLTLKTLTNRTKEFELKKDEISQELLEMRYEKCELELEIKKLKLNKRKVKFAKNKNKKG